MKVLVVAASGSGRGGGHLVRAGELAGSLRRLNVDAWVYLSSNAGSTAVLPLPEELLLPKDTPAASLAWDLVVLDNFRTGKTEAAFYARLAPVLGIDEGGEARRSLDFLVDVLPGINGGPNLTLPSLLNLPENRRPGFDSRSIAAGKLRVMVYFGLEDAAGLAAASAPVLASIDGCRVSALPPLSRDGKISPDAALLKKAGVEVLEYTKSLRERFADYDLIVTHFGLGAFEALYARVPVLLISPTGYHEKLAKNAGLVSLGIREAGIKALRKISRLDRLQFDGFMEKLVKAGREAVSRYCLEEKPGRGLPGLIAAFPVTPPPVNPPRCPACGEARDAAHKVTGRFPGRSYRLCPRCGVTYMLRLAPDEVLYDNSYFFGDYKKQYGKTYIEDFPSLMGMGLKRLRVIKGLLPSTGSAGRPRLLDIGCAYGPFLAAAKSEGFDCAGIDPCEDAVRYVEDRLKIPAFQGFFPDFTLSPDFIRSGFDVITFWFVLEHFRSLGMVMGEAVKLLKPGGLLALATPSSSGLSGLFRRGAFLEKSPADHWTIWNPRRLGGLLLSCGLELKKTVITGHHPERFPLIGPLLRNDKSFAYGFFMNVSRCFKLGDTFEAYAVKARPGKNGEVRNG